MTPSSVRKKKGFHQDRTEDWLRRPAGPGRGLSSAVKSVHFVHGSRHAAGELQPVRQPQGYRRVRRAGHGRLPARRHGGDLRDVDREPPAGAVGHRPGAAGRGARAADARRADQASGRTAAAAGRRAGSAVVRGGRRGRDPGERTTPRGDGRVVRHGPGHARLQRRRDRPDAVRLVAGRRHGGARAPAGAVPGLLAVAAVRVESVPAGAARAPAGPARAGRALLGRLGGQATAGGGHRTAAGGPASVHGAVHGGHERAADAGGGAGAGRPERVRPDRAGRGDHAAERAGGPGVLVAGDLPVARGHVVRAGSQRALVPRAVDVPARRRGGGGAAARLPAPRLGTGAEPPDLSGFAFGGDPVRWLWIIPISERDRQLAKERGSSALVSRLAAQHRSWIVGP